MRPVFPSRLLSLCGLIGEVAIMFFSSSLSGRSSPTEHPTGDDVEPPSATVPPESATTSKTRPMKNNSKGQPDDEEERGT